MNCYTDKETSNLINVSIGLSKIVDKLHLIRDKDDLQTLDKVYDTEKYLEMAKQFLYIPKINKMMEQIEKTYNIFKERGEGDLTSA